MQPITEKTIRLLSRSGLVLIFLSIAGSLAMATIRVSGNVQPQAWNEMFDTLFLAVSAIAVYYLALSVFGLAIVRKKKGGASVFPKKKAFFWLF